MRQDDVSNNAEMISFSDRDRDWIKRVFQAGKVACLTGSGISAESGIPTFRGKGGLWQKYDPEIYANSGGLTALLRKRPQELMDFVVDFYSVLLGASPNAAHRALYVLEKKGILNWIITQNIDNLHQQAGSRAVIELHGNAYRIRCMRCGQKVTLEKDRLKEMIKLLQINRDRRMKALKILSRYFPRCPSCRARYRIDIVLFGEVLPQDELSQAFTALDNCRTLLVLGTSLVVYPAAGLPLYAKEKGVKLIEVNNEPTAFSKFCDYKIRGQAGQAMPEILRIAGYA